MSKVLSTFAAVFLLIGGAAVAEDRQDRCAQAAEKSFRSSGWKTETGSDYASHYNQSLGVCLIEIDGRAHIGGTKSVSDAVDGRTYALYMWGMTGELLSCELIPSQKQKRGCKTFEEYSDFAASLMER